MTPEERAREVVTTGEQIVADLRALDTMVKEGVFDNALLASWIDRKIEEVAEACAQIAWDEYKNPDYGNGRPLAGRYIAEAICARYRLQLLVVD